MNKEENKKLNLKSKNSLIKIISISKNTNKASFKNFKLNFWNK